MDTKRKRLSTAETLVFRFFAIAYWVSLIAFLLFASELLPRDPAILTVVIVGMIILGLLSLLAFTLRVVYASDDRLEFRWFGKVDSVMYSQVVKLSYHFGYHYGFCSVPLVIVSVRTPEGKKRKFRFVARCIFKCWTAARHPDILFISKMSNLHVGGGTAVLREASR